MLRRPLWVVLLVVVGTSALPKNEAVHGAGDYLLRSVDPDEGVIAMTPTLLWVCPYFAGFAAVGLARATAFTGNSSFVAAAWRHLEWHQAHMDTAAPHYITDYERSSRHNPWKSSGDFDSTDSYAALFLLALGEAFRVDPNITRLQALATGLAHSAVAINSTLNKGLTWAKPTYKMKYTMDNAEVFAGLAECGPLADALGLTELAQWCRETARLVFDTAAVELVSTRGDYLVAAGEKLANWTRKYPDALAQVFPPALGLLDPASVLAANLTQTFVVLHPEWCHPLSKDPEKPETTVGWGFSMTGWALRAVGRVADAEAAATTLWEAALADNLAYPFHSSVAGHIIGMVVAKQPYPLESSISKDDGDDSGSKSAAGAHTLTATSTSILCGVVWGIIAIALI